MTELGGKHGSLHIRIPFDWVHDESKGQGRVDWPLDTKLFQLNASAWRLATAG